MSWREAHDAAYSRFTLRDQQALSLNVHTIERRGLLQGSEIIIKNEGGLILRIPNATGTLISRAKIAGRVVVRSLNRRHSFRGALPWALRAVGRYKHPFVRQWIETTV